MSFWNTGTCGQSVYCRCDCVSHRRTPPISFSPWPLPARRMNGPEQQFDGISIRLSGRLPWTKMPLCFFSQNQGPIGSIEQGVLRPGICHPWTQNFLRFCFCRGCTYPVDKYSHNENSSNTERLAQDTPPYLPTPDLLLIWTSTLYTPISLINIHIQLSFYFLDTLRPMPAGKSQQTGQIPVTNCFPELWDGPIGIFGYTWGIGIVSGPASESRISRARSGQPYPDCTERFRV